MKSILFNMVVILLVSLNQGCSKGTNTDTGSNTAKSEVGFPSTANSSLNLTPLNSSSSAIQIIDNKFFVKLFNGIPAASDVHITLAIDNAAIDAYKIANPDTLVINKRKLITILPASYYNLTFTATVRAGDTSVQIPISVLSTIGLNPDSTYAIGLKIINIDGGYTIAPNLAKLLIGFSFLNAYDGVYSDTFTNYHPIMNPTYIGTTITVHMISVAPDRVKIYFPIMGGYFNPIYAAGSLSAFSYEEPVYIINPATNGITIYNDYPYTTYNFTMNSSFNSHYDVATQTFVVKWGYGYLVPGVFDSGCREWTQTIKYLHPR